MVLFAERTKEPAVLHFSAKTASWMDLFFTAPGIILVGYNGPILANAWGGMQTPWIAAGLTLFSLSGIIWIGLLLRYQHQMIRFSEPALYTSAPIPEAFYKVLHKWYFWGSIATLLPLAALIIMVIKP